VQLKDIIVTMCYMNLLFTYLLSAAIFYKNHISVKLNLSIPANC